MHECAARCCSSSVAPVAEVHDCVRGCQGEAQRAQQMVQAELQRFQQGLDRCVAGCQDKVRGDIGFWWTFWEVLCHFWMEKWHKFEGKSFVSVP